MSNPIPYPDDPIPWLTERFAANGCFDTVLVNPYSWPGSPGHGRTQPAPSAKAVTLDTLTAIVSALNDDSRTYSVRWTAEPTASTSFHGKVVNIGGAALMDAVLTDGQKAAVLTGLAYHEVAHVRHTRRLQPAVEKTFGKRPAALRMSNVAEDVRIERLIVREFPGYRDTLPITMRWVAKDDGVKVADLSTYGGRWNAFVGAARYPFAWTFQPADHAWRDEVRAWCDIAAAAHTSAKHIAAVEAGLLLIGKPDPVAPPEPIDEPAEPSEPEPSDPDLSDDDDDEDTEPEVEDEDSDEPDPFGGVTEPAQPLPVDPDEGDDDEDDDEPEPIGPDLDAPDGDEDEDEDEEPEPDDDDDDEPGEDSSPSEPDDERKDSNATGRGETTEPGNSDDGEALPPLDHDFCPSHDESTATGREKGWMGEVNSWQKAEALSEGRRIFRHGGVAKVVRRIKIV